MCVTADLKSLTYQATVISSVLHGLVNDCTMLGSNGGISNNLYSSGRNAALVFPLISDTLVVLLLLEYPLLDCGLSSLSNGNGFISSFIIGFSLDGSVPNIPAISPPPCLLLVQMLPSNLPPSCPLTFCHGLASVISGL